MKIYILLVVFLLALLGCSSNQLAQFNQPAVISTDLGIEDEINRFKTEYGIDDKEITKEIEQSAQFRLNKRLQVRKHIIDSLNISLEKLTVIDYSSHDVSGSYEINYFFYEDEAFIMHFDRSSPNYVLKNIEDFKNENSEVYQLYEIFVLGIRTALNFNSSGPIRSFKITRMNGNKVEYFVVNSLNEEFKCLKGKVLVNDCLNPNAN